MAALRGRFGAPIRAALTLGLVLLVAFLATLAATYAFWYPPGVLQPAPSSSPTPGPPTPLEDALALLPIALYPTLVVLLFAPVFAWLGRQPMRSGSFRFVAVVLPTLLVVQLLLLFGPLPPPLPIVVSGVVAWALLLMACRGRSGWTSP